MEFEAGSRILEKCNMKVPKNFQEEYLEESPNEELDKLQKDIHTHKEILELNTKVVCRSRKLC